MAEPLKNLYNIELIKELSDELKKVHGEFDTVGFQKTVFCESWEDKELKERMRYIALTLAEFLPRDYEQAIAILMPVSEAFEGFEYMFFPDFVELYGLDNFGLSMEALARFTEYSSSEFAIRPFIKKYPSETMAQMESWAESDNEHLRRLASEGSRPRLPWAMALPEFKKDPTPLFRIIKKLLRDESEDVRRSAANNLNDISKDHPQLILKFAKKRIGKNKLTDRLLKHACRTLLKDGNHEALKLFGFPRVTHVTIEEFKAAEAVTMGQSLKLSFVLKTRQKKLGRLRLEYAIDFIKKNHTLSRKVFKISEGDFSVKEKTVMQTHSFKFITTQKYYAGTHGLAIIINGTERARRTFRLDKKN